MIRKSIFTFIAFTLFCASANARLPLIDFGIKGGVTTQNVDFKRGHLDADYIFSTSNKTGWHVGIQTRVNLMMFHIQPEILYSHTAYNMKLAPSASSTDLSSTKVKMNNIDVPVLFGVKMLMFRFQAGPVFSLMTEDKVSGGKFLQEVTIKKPTVSYALGFGADLSRFTADVRYNGYFSRADQTFLVGKGYELKSRISSWTFSLGYMF